MVNVETEPDASFRIHIGDYLVSLRGPLLHFLTVSTPVFEKMTHLLAMQGSRPLLIKNSIILNESSSDKGFSQNVRLAHDGHCERL